MIIDTTKLAEWRMLELPTWTDTTDGLHQMLLKDWTWLGVTLKAGEISDGATSPWWARPWIPMRGIYVFAAYLHDHLLKVTSRLRAAKKFLYALKVLGVPRFKRKLMYRGVRLNDLIYHDG